MLGLEALAPADEKIIQDKIATIIMKRFDSETLASSYVSATAQLQFGRRVRAVAQSHQSFLRTAAQPSKPDECSRFCNHAR